jgi:hypothetical protein
MHYGSGFGFGSGSNIKWNKNCQEIKKKKMPTSWEIMLLLTLKKKDIEEKQC